MAAVWLAVSSLAVLRPAALVARRAPPPHAGLGRVLFGDFRAALRASVDEPRGAGL